MTQTEKKRSFKTNIEDLDVHSVPFSAIKLAKFESAKFECISHRKGSVDLSKVIGCDHPDYAGLPLGVLKPSKRDIFDDEDPEFENQSLTRARRNMLDLQENPEYYLSFAEKRHWSFAEVGGRFYIIEGVHRSVLGRYFFHLNGLPPIVHGVSISKMKPKVEIINTVERNSNKTLLKLTDIIVFAIVIIVVALIFY